MNAGHDIPETWNPDDLDRFPLDSNAMVADLDGELRALLRVYVAGTGKSDRLAAFVDEVAARFPDNLRVKEVFETFEAYKRIGQDVYERWREGRVDAIYDLACGHGLLGVLLAGRFPRVPVVCVDRERRPAFDRYLAVSTDIGRPLPNVSYLECAIETVVLRPDAYVICIHACNEATRDALQMARNAGAHFAAMPCCIRDGIYLRRIKHLDDETRYAVSVGAIAGRFGATRVTAIDVRITNRNLILLGGR